VRLGKLKKKRSSVQKSRGRESKRANKQRRIRMKFNQSSNAPFNLKSRLLAPTEREYVPGARTHVWLDTSQIDRSYLESVTLTVFDSPGCNSTSAKPRRTEGGSPAPSGKCRYTCDIYFFFTRTINRLIQDKEDNTHLRPCDLASILHRE
jgi:hypothetical protein